MTYDLLACIAVGNDHTDPDSGFTLVGTGPDGEHRFEDSEGFAVVTVSDTRAAPSVHREWLDARGLRLEFEDGGSYQLPDDLRFVPAKASLALLAEPPEEPVPSPSERLTPEVVAEFEKCQRLPRKHAHWYNWHHKEGKERSVVEDFLDPAIHEGIHSFDCYWQPEKDPPDAWVSHREEGGRTALELTELVSQEAIEMQIHMGKKKGVSLAERRSYSAETEKWIDKEYFNDRVNETIERKAKKCAGLFGSGHPVQLLLFSDEPYLTECYRDHLAAGSEVTAGQFQRVWLLVSYDPRTTKQRLVKLA